MIYNHINIVLLYSMFIFICYLYKIDLRNIKTICIGFFMSFMWTILIFLLIIYFIIPFSFIILYLSRYYLIWDGILLSLNNITLPNIILGLSNVILASAICVIYILSFFIIHITQKGTNFAYLDVSIPNFMKFVSYIYNIVICIFILAIYSMFGYYMVYIYIDLIIYFEGINKLVFTKIELFFIYILYITKKQNFFYYMYFFTFQFIMYVILCIILHTYIYEFIRIIIILGSVSMFRYIKNLEMPNLKTLSFCIIIIITCKLLNFNPLLYFINNIYYNSLDSYYILSNIIESLSEIFCISIFPMWSSKVLPLIESCISSFIKISYDIVNKVQLTNKLIKGLGQSIILANEFIIKKIPNSFVWINPGKLPAGNNLPGGNSGMPSGSGMPGGSGMPPGWDSNLFGGDIGFSESLDYEEDLDYNEILANIAINEEINTFQTNLEGMPNYEQVTGYGQTSNYEQAFNYGQDPSFVQPSYGQDPSFVQPSYGQVSSLVQPLNYRQGSNYGQTSTFGQPFNNIQWPDYGTPNAQPSNYHTGFMGVPDPVRGYNLGGFGYHSSNSNLTQNNLQFVSNSTQLNPNMENNLQLVSNSTQLNPNMENNLQLVSSSTQLNPNMENNPESANDFVQLINNILINSQPINDDCKNNFCTLDSNTVSESSKHSNTVSESSKHSIAKGYNRITQVLDESQTNIIKTHWGRSPGSPYRITSYPYDSTTNTFTITNNNNSVVSNMREYILMKGLTLGTAVFSEEYIIIPIKFESTAVVNLEQLGKLPDVKDWGKAIENNTLNKNLILTFSINNSSNNINFIYSWDNDEKNVKILKNIYESLEYLRLRKTHKITIHTFERSVQVFLIQFLQHKNPDLFFKLMNRDDGGILTGPCWDFLSTRKLQDGIRPFINKDGSIPDRVKLKPVSRLPKNASRLPKNVSRLSSTSLPTLAPRPPSITGEGLHSNSLSLSNEDTTGNSRKRKNIFDDINTRKKH